MAVLLEKHPISIGKGQPSISVPVVLDAKTERITVLLERPTNLNPIDWSEAVTLNIRVAVHLPGGVFVCDGSSTGGIRRSARTGEEMPQYRLSYTLPHGFFGARSGMPKRLGELFNPGELSCVVTIAAGRGDAAQTTLVVSSIVADAQGREFHSSVAYDNASSSSENGGDGVVSWSHTASGSNRAVFIGSGSTGNAHTSTTATYAGNAAVELWDANHNTFFCNSGYQLAGDGNIPTGSQTVVSDLTLGSGDIDEQCVGVVSMTGVDSTTPVGTHQIATDTGANPTVTVGSVGSDDLVVDNLMAHGGTAVVIGASQTQRNTETEAFGMEFRQSTQLGSDGGQMSWTGAIAANSVSLGAVAFKPFVGGGATVFQKLAGTSFGLAGGRGLAG